MSGAGLFSSMRLFPFTTLIRDAGWTPLVSGRMIFAPQAGVKTDEAARTECRL
jgi:hypothetical protein